jgi:hypothetical protein
MARELVKMVMLPRGETKNARSLEHLAGALPEDAVGTNPDEDGVFEVELEAADIDAARHRVWNAVSVAGINEHVMLLDDDDLPDEWRAHARLPHKPATS